MTSFEKIKLPTVKNIIVVASGKGGVGKSTVSANLAIALARNGMKVALVDADIYGPSIPTMFGINNEQPPVSVAGDKEQILPIEKYGVKIISIGFFIKPNQGLIWRGPMAANAIKQLLETTVWGDIDYMVIDFPPGTGDIQLTIAQSLNISGAIVVTTPQEIALADARKAASMFGTLGIEIPVVGVVENMSWFTPKQHPDEKYFIFGQGGGERLATELKVPLLTQIPLIMEVGVAADKGLSIFSQTEVAAVKALETLAEKVLSTVEV